MKIQFTQPTPMCISEDGSQTERFGIGEEFESKDSWMTGRMKGVVASGRAIEVGGNAEVPETKAKPKKQATRKKVTPKG